MGSQAQRRKLLSALIGVLVMLGAFQNCAAPGVSLVGACEVLKDAPNWVEYHDRFNSLILTVNFETNSIRIKAPGSTSTASDCVFTRALDSNDSAFLKHQLELLRVAPAVRGDLVAMYLHGTTLKYTFPGDDTIQTTWLRPGDATGDMTIACSDSDALLNHLESLALDMQVDHCN